MLPTSGPKVYDYLRTALKSTSGTYTVPYSLQDLKSLFGGMVVHCFSGSQTCMSLSSAEAEYVVAVSAACDGIRLWGLGF